jgi:DNA-binding MarR family transcriptional regulator
MNRVIVPGLTPAGQALSDLMLEVFRLNGRLLAEGDALVAPAGLTSARWQVLGAAATAAEPRTVAQIARRMGLSRQAVQRVTNDLQSSGLIAYRANPDHRRAKLVVPTEPGLAAWRAALAAHVPWTNGLAGGIDEAALAGALAVIRALLARLDPHEPETPP